MQGARLTDEQIERVAESLREYPLWRAAAEYAGITDRTIRRYRTRAERYELAELDDRAEADRPYYEAAQRWRKARSQCEMELVCSIRRAALEDGQWRAALKLLEVGWPEDWGRRARPDPFDMERQRRILTEDATARIEAALAELARKRAACIEAEKAVGADRSDRLTKKPPRAMSTDARLSVTPCRWFLTWESTRPHCERPVRTASMPAPVP